MSSFQLFVDWNQVATSGAAFATAHVSSGLTADASFGANYAGIKAAGMIRGAYQLFRPSQDPVAQANLLLAATGPIAPGDLPPVLDVEVTDAMNSVAITTAIQSWVTTVQTATGRKPIVYTGAFFWNSSVGSAAFSSNPLWVAAWGAVCPSLPSAWSGWAFWQYTGSGSVPGVPGAVDRDKFNGTIDALQLLAGIEQTAVKQSTWGSTKVIYR